MTELSKEVTEQIEKEALERYPLRMLFSGGDLFQSDQNKPDREIWIAGATSQAERHVMEHDAHVLEMMERNEIIQEKTARISDLERSLSEAREEVERLKYFEKQLAKYEAWREDTGEQV